MLMSKVIKIINLALLFLILVHYLLNMLLNEYINEAFHIVSYRSVLIPVYALQNLSDASFPRTSHTFLVLFFLDLGGLAYCVLDFGSFLDLLDFIKLFNVSPEHA